MKKILFVFKRIFKMNFKGFFTSIDNIHKVSGKSKIYLFFDMIYCGFAYGAGYADYELFEFFNLKRYQRKTVVTRTYNNKIVKLFNGGKDEVPDIDDKMIFHERYADILNRDWLNLNKTSESDFVAFMKKHKYAMAKVTDQTGGHGVDKIEYKTDEDAKELYKKLLENKQYLVEEYIKQHEEISKIYPCAINTIRVVSILKNDKVHIISTVIRIGDKGHVVDNFHSEGMFTFIDKDGVIRKPAANKKREVFYKHPYTNQDIVGFKIPYFEEILKYVEMLAKRTPHVGYVGWDIAVTPNGPTVIEGNSYPGHVLYQSKVHADKDGIGMVPVFEAIINEKENKDGKKN